MLARAAQGLIITGMEFTTAAFILCSFGTTYCWWYKGADVAAPLPLITGTTMAKILIDGGDAAAGPYHRTPLDFISRDEWHWSLYWTHWINILRKMHIIFAPRALPHDRLENTIWHNVKARGPLPAVIIISMAYSAIFIASRNNPFPTYAEQILWRISSLSMMATILLYFVVTAFAYVVRPALQRYFQTQTGPSLEPDDLEISSQQSSENESKFAEDEPAPLAGFRTPPKNPSKARLKLSAIAAGMRNNSILKDPSLDVPLTATLPMYLVGFFYCCSRALILVLDMIQLRSLPSSAFATVEWSGFIPHLS